MKIQNKQLNFFKNSIFLLSGILIGASLFLLTQASYTVQTNIYNAVQVIKRIVLQMPDGVTTGSILSGNTINTVNMQATQYCDEAGSDCKNIADLITGYIETDPIFMIHSGDYYTTGEADARYLTGEILTQSGTNLFYTGGNVGIGTTNPQAKLDVEGTTKTSNLEVTNEIRLGGTNIAYVDINWMHFGDWENDGLGLAIHNNGGYSIILTGGNVGIGTTKPQAKLDVDGGIKLKAYTNPDSPCIATATGTLFLDSTLDLCVCMGGNDTAAYIKDGTQCR